VLALGNELAAIVGISDHDALGGVLVAVGAFPVAAGTAEAVVIAIGGGFPATGSATPRSAGRVRSIVNETAAAIATTSPATAATGPRRDFCACADVSIAAAEPNVA
jgi:hypothetical protein